MEVLIENIRLARTTPAYLRMTQAGFTFEELQVREEGHFIAVQCYFTCVCGRREGFMWTETKRFFEHYRGTDHLWIDVAGRLEKLGSVSVEHLREDGYSDQEIERIRAPYNKQGWVRAAFSRMMGRG